MIEYSKLSEMTVEQALDILTDQNWHTERVLIEAILCGSGEDINNALTVAINHQLVGHLQPEMNDLRKRVASNVENY